MRFLLSQNKKIILIALSILIVSASFFLLIYDEDSAPGRTNVLSNEIVEDVDDGEMREASIEDIKSMNELFDAR